MTARPAYRPAYRIVHRTLAAATGEGNPRNSEGDLLDDGDGRLYLAYTGFVGAADDFATAGVAVRTSADGGASWSAPTVVRRNPGGVNAMCPSLADVGDRRLLLYLRKNGRDDCSVHLATSLDGGATWPGPDVPVSSRPGYWVVENARLLVLPGGRLLTAGAHATAWAAGCRFVARVLASDDGGASWRETGAVDVPDRRGAWEPDLARVGDEVVMAIRTHLGGPWIARSADGGETWSAPTPSGLRSPSAPQTLAALPGGDLLIVYNDHPDRRCPLSIARSSDAGRTFTPLGDLEPDAYYRYGYASVASDGDDLLLTYYESRVGPQPGVCHLVFSRARPL